MADVTVSVKLEGDKASLREAGAVIAEGLQNALTRLGIGSDMQKAFKVGKGGMGEAAGTVMQGALLATGVGLLKFIADALADMPIITSIMKLLKVILALLFLPLIPILIPVLKLLSTLATSLSPVMIKISDAIDKLLSGGEVTPQELGDIGKGLWDTVQSFGKAWMQIWDSIGQGLYKSMMKFMQYFDNIGVKLWKATVALAQNLVLMFANIWDIHLKPVWQWLVLQFYTIWNIVKEPFVKLGSAISNVASSIMSSIKSLFRGKATGGYVGEEGIYHLHRGERVLSNGENKASSSRSTTNSPSITIQINNPSVRNDDDIKNLVKQISRVQQQNMRRYTSY